MKVLSVVILVLIGVLVISGLLYAEITAEIISKDIDDKGNIRVWTQYKNNGIEVTSNYPKIDGKSVYCTRYNAMNFDGFTDSEIIAYIKADIKTQTDNLIRQDYNKVKYPDMVKANSNLNKDRLNGLVGESVLSIEVTQKKILPGGELLKEIVIKQDGTYKVK